MGLSRTALFVRRSVGGLFAVEDMHISTGARIFVHSGTGTDAGGYGTGPDKPVATLDYAIGKCTASKGDIIYVMPGHAENLATITAVNMDVAGVRVVGLGQGRLRPQFTITAAAGSITVGAANCSIENIDIVNNFLNIVASITVTADGTGLTLDNVGIYDTSVILGSLIGIKIAALASDVTIKNFAYKSLLLTAEATNCILCAGAADRLTIRDASIHGGFSNFVIGAETAASVDMDFRRIMVYNAGTGGGIHVHASSTGIADDIYVYNAAHTVIAFTGEAIMRRNVWYTNVVGLTGIVNQAADA